MYCNAEHAVWRTVLLEKLLVAQLLNKFRIISVTTKLVYGHILRRTNLLLTFPHYSLKIHFNMPPYRLTTVSSSLFTTGSFYLQNSSTQFWPLHRVLHYHSTLPYLTTPISSADHAAARYGCSPAPRCPVSLPLGCSRPGEWPVLPNVLQ